jgi:hypothetical protein
VFVVGKWLVLSAVVKSATFVDGDDDVAMTMTMLDFLSPSPFDYLRPCVWLREGGVGLESLKIGHDLVLIVLR